MHDTTDGSHWHEPEGLKNAGYGAWKRPNTPYDEYMEAQGIPIYRGIGVRRAPDKPPQTSKPRGGESTLFHPFRTRGQLGRVLGGGPGAGGVPPPPPPRRDVLVGV